MRIAIALVLALHGAIHLLGFLKWCGIAQVPPLQGRTLCTLSDLAGRVVGGLWLVACALMIVAAAMCLRESAWWWKVAACAIVFSQILIAMAWSDAKAGTLANLLLVVPVVVGAAHARFERRIDREVHRLLASSNSARASLVKAEELAALPAPVSRWLLASGVVGQERAETVRLRQRGMIRTSPHGAWMPADAVQYFSVDDPGFVWKIETRMMGVVPITGRDLLAGGKGHMLIKAGSLVSVVDASDEKIAIGAMLRFLGEIVWFPSAALSSSITWEDVDDGRARATLRHAGKEVSAEFSIDARGRVTSVSASRYLGGGEDAKLFPWQVTIGEWKTIRGVEMPVRGNVVWQLPSGVFDYYRWEILDVETNVPALYPETGSRAREPLAITKPSWRVCRELGEVRRLGRTPRGRVRRQCGGLSMS
jgi:hypothetical protein